MYSNFVKNRYVFQRDSQHELGISIKLWSPKNKTVAKKLLNEKEEFGRFVVDVGRDESAILVDNIDSE